MIVQRCSPFLHTLYRVFWECLAQDNCEFISSIPANNIFLAGHTLQLHCKSLERLISGVMTIIIALALKYTMGWRIPEEHEVEGVDLTTHGEAAYDLEPSSGSGASGVLTGHTPKTQEVTA